VSSNAYNRQNVSLKPYSDSTKQTKVFRRRLKAAAVVRRS